MKYQNVTLTLILLVLLWMVFSNFCDQVGISFRMYAEIGDWLRDHGLIFSGPSCPHPVQIKGAAL